MPCVPAICQCCGIVFPTIYEVHPGGSPQLFDGCMTGPCPHCGEDGWVPDGLYAAIGDTLTCMGGCEWVPEIQHLINVFETAYEQESNAEDIAERIRSEVPKFAPVADHIPEDRTDRCKWLMLMLALLQTVLAGWSVMQPARVVNIDIDQVIYQTCERCNADQP